MANLNNKVQEFRRHFNITAESFDQVFKLDPKGNLKGHWTTSASSPNFFQKS